MSLVSIPMLDTIEAYYMNVLLVTMHSKTFQILQFSFLHSRYSNTIHNSLKIIEKRHILLKRNSELLPKMQQSCIAVGALSNRLKTLWWQYMCVAFIQCTLFCESKRLCTLHMVIKEIQRSLDVVKLSFALHKSEFDETTQNAALNIAPHRYICLTSCFLNILICEDTSSVE